MNNEELYKQLITEFKLEALSPEDQEMALLTLAKTIQKQFLLDIFDVLGEEKFKALEASINMGETFYDTTLKHLLPNYEEIFSESRNKIIDSFKKHEKEVVRSRENTKC